nr:N-acetylmuramoyl-L-alanine amidase [Paraliobacillus salinarum]
MDPGHGGKDNGGGSNSIWIEKEFVLRISLYQYARLQELGIPVEMTRYSDKYLASEERVNRVIFSKATYCISNHINSGGGIGAELIHSIHTDGNRARVLAKKIKEANQNVRRVFTRSLSNNEKRDYYFMHRETGQVETIIIEYGFADSIQDQKKLSKDWIKLAEAVVEGICLLTNTPYKEKTNISGEGEQPTAWYIGRRVESIVDELRYYRQPGWGDQYLVNTINKGIGFPKIVDKIKVENGEQYKVKNSKGDIYYITANDKYVIVK